MTERTDSEADREGGHTTPERHDWTNTALDESTASRKTLARRLRAVERALGGVEAIEGFEPAVEADTSAEAFDEVDARLVALERAVRVVGEYIADRDRVRRVANGTDSVRRAVESLPEPDVEAGANDERVASRADGSIAGFIADDSPTEWLDCVAAGGVTPPRIE